MDASKQLLQVGLDDVGIGSLSQDLQEIVIPNEVETREDGPFLLSVYMGGRGGIQMKDIEGKLHRIQAIPWLHVYDIMITSLTDL